MPSKHCINIVIQQVHTIIVLIILDSPNWTLKANKPKFCLDLNIASIDEKKTKRFREQFHCYKEQGLHLYYTIKHKRLVVGLVFYAISIYEHYVFYKIYYISQIIYLEPLAHYDES